MKIDSGADLCSRNMDMVLAWLLKEERKIFPAGHTEASRSPLRGVGVFWVPTLKFFQRR